MSSPVTDEQDTRKALIAVGALDPDKFETVQNRRKPDS